MCKLCNFFANLATNDLDQLITNFAKNGTTVCKFCNKDEPELQCANFAILQQNARK